MSFSSPRVILIDILTKLLPYWPLAQSVKILIESEYCTDTLVDGLLAIVAKAIHTVKDEKARKDLQQSLKKVKELKTKEKVIQDRESNEADDLLITL